MTRWLGIDHGEKRTGIAVGSTAEGIATPLVVISTQPLTQAMDRIVQIAKQYEAQGFVVGLPLNADDTEGPQAKIARAMACDLAAASGMDVRLWDERLSSFAADEVLAGKLTRKKKRRRHDAVAAAVILQDFLSQGGPDSAPKATTSGEQK